LIFTFEQRRWVNRGFLSGPVCPIYGSGAIMILLVLQPLRDWWPLLLATAILLTTILEYLTSWLMEKLFHARWWDYSGKPFNLHGRITLLHSLSWGVLCLILVYFLDPLLVLLLAGIPADGKAWAGAVALFLLIVDLVLSVSSIVDLNRQLARVHAMTQVIRQKNIELGENIQMRLTFMVQNFKVLRQQAKNISHIQRRLLAAFPNFRSLHYQDSLQRLRRWMKKNKQRQFWPMADMELLRSQFSARRRLPAKIRELKKAGRKKSE